MSNDSASVSHVLDRLGIALNVGTDAELAEILQMKPQTLANRKQRASIPYAEICRVAHERELSLDFIFLGKGSPVISSGEIDPNIMHEIGWELSIAGPQHGLKLDSLNMGCYLSALIYNRAIQEIKPGESWYPLIKREAVYIAKIKQKENESPPHVHPEEQKQLLKQGATPEEVYGEPIANPIDDPDSDKGEK